ncbi:hypothetical protein J3459_022295 [Metarhizium acridum]|nr:hypothetical protein J3459_022295 [Metarhizium acridum]
MCPHPGSKPSPIPGLGTPSHHPDRTQKKGKKKTGAMNLTVPLFHELFSSSQKTHYVTPFFFRLLPPTHRLKPPSPPDHASYARDKRHRPRPDMSYRLLVLD